MTIGNNIPFFDNAIIGAELIEQYLEEKRNAEREYVREMNILFAEATCSPCEDQEELRSSLPEPIEEEPEGNDG